MIPLPRRIKRSIRKILARAVAAAANEPEISERVHGRDRAFVDPTARLLVEPNSASMGHICLGKGTRIFRHAEVTAYGGGSIEIGDDTSLQDFCVVYGDVRIGAHCLFAKHVFLSSTTHHFRHRPEWLIRDQDIAIYSQYPDAIDIWSKQVWIEDDCWFGWCAVVLPGVYVGRGAVIGAHCVVTSDVAPYEIHGGVPNRQLSSRLTFTPPATIDALHDAAIPYFYRGFILSQPALDQSRKLGIVEGCRNACIVLSGSRDANIGLRGYQFNTSAPTRVQIRLNGWDRGEQVLAPGSFEFCINGKRQVRADSAVPGPLQKYTYIELETISEPHNRPGYGISAAWLC
jgi:acetyltransferase-like isoleucine patch superfamily enzyme